MIASLIIAPYFGVAWCTSQLLCKNDVTKKLSKKSLSWYCTVNPKFVFFKSFKYCRIRMNIGKFIWAFKLLETNSDPNRDLKWNQWHTELLGTHTLSNIFHNYFLSSTQDSKSRQNNFDQYIFNLIIAWERNDTTHSCKFFTLL